MQPDLITLADEFDRWLDENFDADDEANRLRDWRARMSHRWEWERRLDAAGWLTLNWPAEVGGHGWSNEAQAVVYERAGARGAPRIANVGGRAMVAPLLFEFGTDTQRERYLPGIRESRELWCQAFSEPDAGSDLYALTTRLARTGDRFTINGQKTWVTNAPLADYAFVMVRDAEAAAEGVRLPVRLVFIDLHAPGVTVAPIEKLTGEDDFASIYFDEVVVDETALVGSVEQSREIIFAVLGFERATVWFERYLRMAHRAQVLGIEARGETAQRARELQIKANGLVHMAREALKNLRVGQASSFVKVAGTQLDIEIADLSQSVIGTRYRVNDEVGVPEIDQREWIQTISSSVAAGVDEVQLETIAKILGIGKGAAHR